MGSTNAKQHSSSKAIVTARNLVAAVMVSGKRVLGAAAAKLFGVSNVFARTQFSGEAIIDGGNVAAFLKERINRFGLNGIKLPTTATALNDAIVNIAQQIVATTSTGRNELNDEQFGRIALEYVTSACCAPAASIESFEAYLVRSRELRKAVKALNAASAATTAEAFSKDADLGTITRILAQARQAWATITRLLQESPHLATLRTQFDVPPLFVDTATWERVRVIPDDLRTAVLTEICEAMRGGNPYVTAATVEQAFARILGNTLLSVGNVNGVTVDAAIEAMAASRTPGVRPNGGTQVGFEGTPAFAIGDALRGMRAYVRGTAKRKDGKTIGYELDVTEGASPSAPMTVPIGTAIRPTTSAAAA